MKECKYCREDSSGEFVSLNDTADYSGLELAMYKKMLRARCFHLGSGDMVTQDIVNIKYCPMCGRKLV